MSVLHKTLPAALLMLLPSKIMHVFNLSLFSNHYLNIWHCSFIAFLNSFISPCKFPEVLSLPFLTGVLISDVIKNVKLPPLYWRVDPRQLSQHCDSSPCSPFLSVADVKLVNLHMSRTHFPFLLQFQVFTVLTLIQLMIFTTYILKPLDSSFPFFFPVSFPICFSLFQVPPTVPPSWIFWRTSGWLISHHVNHICQEESS